MSHLAICRSVVSVLISAGVVVAGLMASGIAAAQSPQASPCIGCATADPGAPMVADVKVGERVMHVSCVGPHSDGQPTVILEAGLGGSSADFDALMPLLDAASVHACAYDRAGLGASDPLSGPVTTAAGVTDLHGLLAAAGIAPPYVMVAHSLGGWYARVFTAAYPDEVAGVVFIDAVHPGMADRLAAALPPSTPGEDPAITDFRSGTPYSVLVPAPQDGWLDLVASAPEVVASGDLGDRPVVVLTHDPNGQPWDVPEPYSSRLTAAWMAMQDELASLSTRGVQRTIAHAGHMIQVDQPVAVATAIEDVLAAVAAGPGALPGDVPGGAPASVAPSVAP